MSAHFCQEQIAPFTARHLLAHEQEVHRKSWIEWVGIFDFLDIFRCKFNAKSLDIAFQVIDFAATNNGKYVRSLVHNVRQAGDAVSLFRLIRGRNEVWRDSRNAGHDRSFFLSFVL